MIQGNMEMIKNLEELGAVFCQDGGEIFKASSGMAHLDSEEFSNKPNWVALGPLDPKLSEEARELVRPAL